jgi:four helix bundle protein
VAAGSTGCGSLCALNRGYWKRELSSLFYQLAAASLSVRLNIAEGHALGRPALQQRHYRIAYGSIIETIELLDMLGKVADHIPPTALQEIHRAATDTRGLLLGLMRRTARIVRSEEKK